MRLCPVARRRRGGVTIVEAALLLSIFLLFLFGVFEYARLLSHVSLLVFQHFGLAPHLRLLNAQGILGDDVFEHLDARVVVCEDESQLKKFLPLRSSLPKVEYACYISKKCALKFCLFLLCFCLLKMNI